MVHTYIIVVKNEKKFSLINTFFIILKKENAIGSWAAAKLETPKE